jgi:phosphomannomutase
MSSEISRTAAAQWSAMDPNETTRRVVEEWLSADTTKANTTLIEKHFPVDQSRISFGTAGLRAEMKPGPLYMNDLVVIQTAQGLASYCQAHDIATVIIGYDHRARSQYNLSSRSFAIYSALVFQEANIKVVLLDGFVATPLVPFSVNQFRNNNNNKAQEDATATSALGIMITASHNPKNDAGYKIYASDGCQIRPPMDRDIGRLIESNLTPWIDYGKRMEDIRTKRSTTDCLLGLSDPDTTKSLIDAYFAAMASSGLVTTRPKSRIHDDSSSSSSPVTFCYSAMHGVGHTFCKRAFEVFHLPPFISVPSQQEPDPDFPTVAFPNPEEKGALDIAKAFAQSHNCQVILANDPDADRLAVAEYNNNNNEQGQSVWTTFTGDEIGVMLGHWLWTQFKDESSATTTATLAMCASTVSSGMLREIARVEGFYFEDTLTGFKWIGSRAFQLTASKQYRTIFCYEEAIGFCCGDLIYDKDGITAASVFAELTLYVYKEKKQTLLQHMQSLYDKYGEFVSNNGYFIVTDDDDDSSMMVISKIMKDLTNHGAFDNTLSQAVGPYQVQAIRYLGEPGYDSRTLDKQPTLPISKSAPMLSYYFENGLVAQFRGSGTEPKFKYYIELKGQPGVSRAQVTSDLQEMSQVVLEELFGKYIGNGLKVKTS